MGGRRPINIPKEISEASDDEILTAVDLIGAVATVVVAITSVLRGNTLTVMTFYLVLSTAVGG